MLLLATLLAVCAPLPARAQCDTRQANVLLNACPLPEVALADGDSMSLTFGSYEWALPFVRRADEVVDGHFVLRGKGFGANGSPPRAPGPTLRFAKGARVRLDLLNALVPLGAGEHDVNIHTHGLHVSSAEDDPGIVVAPGAVHAYNYTMPTDHAGGTHWYHPHMHPLSELYSTSGAAGALLVDDAADGTEAPAEVLAAPQQVLVFQYVHLARLIDLSDGIENDPLSPRTGVVDTTFAVNMTQAGPGSSGGGFGVGGAGGSGGGSALAAGVAALKEGLYTVNGFWRPRLELERGRWYRWRLLNAEAVLDLKLALYDSQLPSTVSAQCRAVLVAKDGVYLQDGPRVMDFSGLKSVHLHPANRADLLVRCDGPVGSVAELYDNFNGFTNGLVDDAKPDPVLRRERMLSLSVVAATAAAGGLFPEVFAFTPCLPFYLKDLLSHAVPQYGGFSASERTALSGSVRPNYWDRWTTDGTTFRITITPFSLNDVEFGGWKTAAELAPDYRNVTLMKIGQVQQWEVTTVSRNHPLHVHVNHFQLLNDTLDETGFHKRGDWVDTIRPRGYQAALIRFQADTFTGFVPLHCHNHDHADEGAVAAAFVVDNPLEPDLRVRSLTRPWADSCAAPVLLRTLAPTRLPTAGPSRRPTGKPTVSPTRGDGVTSAPTQPTPQPTLQPSGAAPTPQPTVTPLIVRINTVANTLYSHAGVVLSSRVETAAQNLPITYCWVRRAGAFVPELEVQVQALVSRESCALSAAEREQLRVVYATASDGPNLIIRPYSVQVASGGRETFRYELRARQGASESIVADFIFRVYGFPEPPLLQTNRAQGVAAVTTFDLTAAPAAASGNGTGFQYRFAVERNAAGAEPMSLSGWTSGATLSQVVLPFAQDTEDVSFISVVAFAKDAFGAESRKSEPLFIRLTAPESVEGLDVTAGFDPASAEQTLRAQLAYASVVARAVADASVETRAAARAPAQLAPSVPGRELQSRGPPARGLKSSGVSADEIRQTKQLIASAVSEALGLLRESAFSRPMNELIMFVLRELAFGLDAADRAVVETVAQLYVMSLSLWLNHITAALEAARALNTEPNLAFLIPEGVMAVASEVLSELSALPQLCEYSFSLPDLHRVIVDTVFAARLAGQEGFSVSLDLLQSVSRKELAPNVAGVYTPPGGRSAVQLPAADFDAGARPEYEEVLASVFRAPPRTFCSQGVLVSTLESSSRGSSGTGTSGTGTGGRGLQYVSATAVQNVVTDVLHLELVRGNVSAPPVAVVNVTLEVLYYAAPEDGEASDVVCGRWDAAAVAWDPAGCAVRAATGALSLNGALLLCECAQVAASADFAAWFLSSAPLPAPAPPADASAAVFTGLAGGLALAWLGLSAGLFARDRRDARRVQRGAVLARLADKDRRGPRPRLGGEQRRRRRLLLRGGFEKLRVAPPAAGPGAVKTVGGLCGDVFAQHSVCGTLWRFDPLLDRVSRSLVLLLAASSALAGVALLDLVDAQPAGEWAPGPLLLLAVVVFAHVVGVRALLRMSSRARKRALHRAAHLRTRALALTPLPPVVDPMIALAGKYGARRDAGSAASKRPLSDTERRRLLALQQQQVGQYAGRLAPPPGLEPDTAHLVVAVAGGSRDSSALSAEQEELFERQAAVFSARAHLRGLKAAHDRLASPQARWLRGVRGACWFLPGRAAGGDDGMDRVYGGQARLSSRARRQQRALSKLERDFSLRPGVCGSARAAAAAAALVALGGAHLYLVARGVGSFVGAEVGVWLAQAAAAGAVAVLLLEPLALFALSFSCYPTLRGAAQDGPRLAQARTRFYSWDSTMSTRTADARRASAAMAAVGARRGAGGGGGDDDASTAVPAARWRRPSGKARRTSVVSAATSATAALSRFFPRQLRPPPDLSSDEEGDDVFHDGDSEADELTRAAAAAARSRGGGSGIGLDDDDDDLDGVDGDDGYETAGESTLAPSAWRRSVRTGRSSAARPPLPGHRRASSAATGPAAGGRARRPSAMLAAALSVAGRTRRRSAAPPPDVDEDAPDYLPDDMHYV